MDRMAFRLAVHGYRRPTGHTQHELAQALGLHPKVLSHKLNGSDGALLRHDEVRGIVRVLAAWAALTSRTQAIELLELAGLGPDTFSSAEWADPPLAHLQVDQPQPPTRPVHSRSGRSELRQRTNLPAALTPLVGRANELRQVIELFGDGARLVTLTGAGGTGKTRLAVAVGNAWAAHSSDQVHLVQLAAVSDRELVARAIAEQLGLREAESSSGIPAVLLDYLRDQHLLLVLDNLEQVRGSAALIADMLRVAPGLRILATSRIALHVYGEHQFRVPALGLPSPDASTQDALASEAVSLFIQRARAAGADFGPEPPETALIAEICSRLDGLPLAIELAAAYLRHISLQALSDRLSSRLDLLNRGPRGVPARQRTLRASLDWSYALLSPSQQRLFARVSIFVGGCTVAAARAVCSEEGEDVEAGLWDLVDNALLEICHASEAGHAVSPSRFRMPDMVREYALVRLAESGDADTTRDRYRDWYLLQLDNCRVAGAWCRSQPIDAAASELLEPALAG